MPNMYDWSENPSKNQVAEPGVDWHEGMPANLVNNSARNMMASLRKNLSDSLYDFEPVVGANNLSITLKEDFDDYVDGMIVRFRCPNDIAKVPDNPLLCITNIPVDKRGNDGNGLPMVMMSWDRTAKGLRVKQATGDMFVAGAHVQAVYSSIHHIWTAADYAAEQKAERHLLGDTMALLKNSPEWQKFVDDKGVWFVYTDSNMAEIQRMIEGTANDTLYSCTNFPLMNTDTYQSPVYPLAVANGKKKDANGNDVVDDDGNPVYCPQIVRNPSASRNIAGGVFHEDSVWGNVAEGTVYLPLASGYTGRGLCELLKPYIKYPLGNGTWGWVNMNAAPALDRGKLKGNMVASGKFTLASEQTGLECRLVQSIALRNPGAQASDNLLWNTLIVDGWLLIDQDYNPLPRPPLTISAYTNGDSDTVCTLSLPPAIGNFSKGDHTLEVMVFWDDTDRSKRYPAINLLSENRNGINVYHNTYSLRLPVS